MSSESIPIKAVSLVGYQFESLNILPGSSQTFTLSNGMPAGYEEINIIVSYQRASRLFNLNITKDVNRRDVTRIQLKGCISAEGCPGFYLE